MAHTRSINECCFKNSVDMQINMHSTNELFFTHFLFLKYWLVAIPTCIAMELYTCMLGHTLVSVSVEYSNDIIFVKILSRSNESGRMFCAFGKNVYIIRLVVIPITSMAAHL